MLRAEEHGGFRDRVVKNVKESAKTSERAAETKPQRYDAHVLDARIR